MRDKFNVDYSNWKNPDLISLANKVDTDNIKGLNRVELFNFFKEAKACDIAVENIYNDMGVSISSQTLSVQRNPEFEQAKEYYNKNLDSYSRSSVTNQTFTNLEERLYRMEKAIDDAFIKCDAYKDIVIAPRRYYAYYPNLNDKLINFDIEEIRNITQKDMRSLQELKENIEYIIEDANCETTHTVPQKTDYNVDSIAEKHLGMSYDEFSSIYKEELNFCKTVTAADFYAMNDTQRMVYSKAKAYAAEMLQTTINEARTTNWDAGERKVSEILKATDNILIISDFESEGITEERLSSIESGILYKAFEDAVISKFKDEYPTSIGNITQNNNKQKAKKEIVNNVVKIISPDGKIYNIDGKEIK